MRISTMKRSLLAVAVLAAAGGTTAGVAAPAAELPRVGATHQNTTGAAALPAWVAGTMHLDRLGVDVAGARLLVDGTDQLFAVSGSQGTCALVLRLRSSVAGACTDHATRAAFGLTVAQPPTAQATPTRVAGLAPDGAVTAVLRTTGGRLKQAVAGGGYVFATHETVRDLTFRMADGTTRRLAVPLPQQ